MLLRVAIGLLSCISSAPSIAGAAGLPEASLWNLSLSWTSRDSPDVQAPGCKVLGQAMTEGNGPFGQGPFRQFICEREVVRAPETAVWRIELEESSNRLAVAARYFASGIESAPPMQPITINLENLSLSEKTFVDRSAALALAALILDKLPAVAAKAREPKTKDGIRLTGVAVQGARPAPELVSYALSFEPKMGLWLPRPCGEAKLLTSKKVKGRGRDKRTWSYGIRESRDCGSPPVVWLHHPEGPGHHQTALESNLRSIIATESVLQLGRENRPRFLADDALGYVGVRLGKQVRPGSAFIRRLVFASLFAEWRGTIAAGLRLYVEGVPQSSDESDPDVSRFGWQRTQISYALGLRTNWVVDRVELAPRLGIMSLVTEAVPSGEEPGTTQRFAVRQQPALGALLCLEKRINPVTIRGWAGSDVALPLPESLTPTRIVSTSLGVDLFLSPPSLRNAFGIDRGLSFTAFLLDETTSITVREKEPAEDAQVFTYGMTFIGFGTMASW